MKQYAPATERNRQPILEILQQVLPATGTVLEISSGTGEHCVFFAPQLDKLYWQPSDPSPEARSSIAAWQEEMPSDRMYSPIDIDASRADWGLEALNFTPPIAAIVNINMIHIAPPSAYRGLMAGAGQTLPVGGILYLYGPFKQHGGHTAPSNAAFDESLQARNPEWGVRDLETIIATAQANHLQLQQVYPMPANNLSVVFQKI